MARLVEVAYASLTRVAHWNGKFNPHVNTHAILCRFTKITPLYSKELILR